MNKGRNYSSTIISALVGCSVALITCIVFFYVVAKPTRQVEAQPTPVATPDGTPMPEISDPEVKPEDVSSVSINTTYPGYFEAGDRCAKTYNQYFGNEDGIGSSDSPCTIEIDFGRDGKASRVVKISRWDKVARSKRVVKTISSTADLTAAQFEKIVDTITANKGFKEWRNGTSLYVSNCTITVNHSGGSKSPMSNVSEKTTAYLPMVEAFKELEKQLTWKVAGPIQ